MVSCLLIVSDRFRFYYRINLFPCCAYSRQQSESDHSTHPTEYDESCEGKSGRRAGKYLNGPGPTQAGPARCSYLFSASLTDGGLALRTTQLIYTRSRRTAPEYHAQCWQVNTRVTRRHQVQVSDYRQRIRSLIRCPRNISRLRSRRTERRSTDRQQHHRRRHLAAVEQLSSAHAARSRTRRCLVRKANVVVVTVALRAYSDLVGNVAISLKGLQLGGVYSCSRSRYRTVA
jgi:hypothetical protein